MKITYESLIKSSLRLTSLGIILGVISISSLIFMNIFDYIQKYGIDKHISISAMIYIFIILVLIVMANVLSASSKLSSNAFINSVRSGMMITYLLLVLFNIIEMIADIPLQYAGIPSYIALYSFILILFIISSVLIKKGALGTEEKVLYIAGTVIDIVSASIALIILMHILGVIFKYAPFRVLIPFSCFITLIIFIWVSIENILGKTAGKTNTITLWTIILRRIATVIASIMLGSIVLYFDVKAVVDMLNYGWTLTSINETFYLLLLISLVISLIAIIIGLVGGFIFIPSNHGVMGISLLTRISKGESIDLSVLGISVTTELPPQKYKPAEKPSEAPTLMPTIVQPQPTPTEIKPTITKCQFCGAEIPANAKFCPYCGAYLATDEGTRLYTEPK